MWSDRSVYFVRFPAGLISVLLCARAAPLVAALASSPSLLLAMLRLHGHELSGNSYKVRLLLELLGVP